MIRFFKNKLKIFFSLLFISLVYIFPNVANAGGSSLGLIRDTEIENILHDWSEPIFKAANLDPNAINIILVQNDAVNAFVAGGSNIFIYTGLISKTETPEELIGVIAHETGHIAGGHLIKGRKALERASYESIVGTIIGVGAAILTGEGGALPALSLGSSSMAQRRYLAHSRVNEASADQAALTFLEAAHINPTGMKSFMYKLKSENYVPETQQSEYIRTHPLVDNRIEALSRRVAESKYNKDPYNPVWKEQHARIKAKLIGFIHPEQIPWVYDDRDKSIPAKYARAIAAYRQNKINLAISRIDDLLKIEPDNPYFLELKGQMLVDFGRVKEAIGYYKKAIDILPSAALFRISLARALIETAGDNKLPLMKAVEQLELVQRSEQRSTRIHRLLATAYGRLGKDNRAKLHLAEEAVLQRKFDYAKQHAQSVLKSEKEGSNNWIMAKDIISFIETTKK